MRLPDLLCLLGLLCTCAPRPPAPTTAPLSTRTAAVATLTVFPGEEWQYADPQTLGIDPQALDSALAYLKTHCKDDGLEEVMIIRHGKVAWAGDSITKVHDIWSCTKSFTSAAAGMMIEEGLIGIDQPVANHEPRLRQLYPEATYRHFLTMTSGYDAEGDSRWGEPSQDWSLTPYQPTTPLFPPGSAYTYWDEAMIMLGRAMTQAAGVSLNDYLDERLFQKVGIAKREWWGEGYVSDSVKINFGGTGLKMSAQEQARLGLLYLNHGNWDGDQLIDSNWVAASITNQVSPTLALGDTDRADTDGRGIYGYNWWVIPATDEHPAAAYTSGLNHNVCMIVPEWDMAVVRMGVDGNPEAGKQMVYSDFLQLVGGGVAPQRTQR